MPNGKDLIDDIQYEHQIDEWSPERLTRWTAKQIYYQNEKFAQLLKELNEVKERLKEVEKSSDRHSNRKDDIIIYIGGGAGIVSLLSILGIVIKMILSGGM